ncbi:MAG: cupredoxin domain-containing protein [Chloroflexi bacterium]|nr:cupredoxin domain-containing protein [Chloroflexota bacterium]
MRSRGLLVFALVGLLLVAAACGGKEEVSPASTPRATATPATSAPAAAAAEIKVALDDSKPEAPRFNPSTFDLQVGKAYRFVVGPGLQFHTFTSDALAINESILAGETKTVNFTPSKAGSFKLVCLAHEALGQTGTINVK